MDFHLSREAASTAGGSTVIVNGRNFRTHTSVLFGNVPAESIQVVSDTTIKCRIPRHEAGIVDVTVLFPDGSAEVLPRSFEFLPPPTRYFLNEDWEKFPTIKDNSCQSYVNDEPLAGKQIFQTGTPGTAGCTGVNIDVHFSHTGSRSLRVSGNDYLYWQAPENIAVQESNGFYQRWYFYLAAADIRNALDLWKLEVSQWKLTLARYDSPGFMLLSGPLAGSATHLMVEHSGGNDWGNGNAAPNCCWISVPAASNGGNFFDTGITLSQGWHEVQIWQRRSAAWTDPSCSQVEQDNVYGKAKVWIDGRLVVDIQRGCTIANDRTKLQKLRQGMLFAAYTDKGPKFSEWFDDVVFANGFVDPTP